MSGKHWSYRQITQAAEKAVSRNVLLAIHAEVEGEHQVAAIFRARADGVVQLWSDLTMGWQEDDDGLRLESLASSKDPSAK